MDFAKSIFNGFLVLSILMTSQMLKGLALDVKVDVQSYLANTDSKFLSVAIGAGIVQGRFHGFPYKSITFQTLAKGLSPCWIRLGGTRADYITFEKETASLNNRKGPAKINPIITLEADQWDEFNKFLDQVGWDLMFDFNVFRWREDGLWDSTNAEALIKYSSDKGYRALKAFQLGNEPNSYRRKSNISIPADNLVKNFRILRDVFSRYPLYMNNSLYGPDLSGLWRSRGSRSYLQSFINAGGNNVVDEISLHHYYLGRNAQARQFYNVTVLDSLKSLINWGHDLASGSPIRLTETSSASGGGAPGLSDRYIAGFLWLDKLGLAAKFGVTGVFRQTFIGGSYGLISRKRLSPCPDYWLSLLHKRLIEGPVFNVSTQQSTNYLRVYAHCTRNYGFYKRGDLTLAYLNIHNASVPISLSQFPNHPYDAYILTPGDSAGLTSSFVNLNGRTLQMNGAALPSLKPASHKGSITLPGLSFGFIVVPNAKVAHCTKNV